MSTTVTEVWSDLHQDLKVDAQGAIKKVINIDAVKTSIDNILRTSKGERVMLREFGSDLKSMVFENIDESLQSLAVEGIKDAIERWDDRVIVNAINFKGEPDKNQVTIVMNFSVRGYDNVFSLSTSV